MHRVEIIRVPARLSLMGVDELYYEVEPGDWHDRVRRLQNRRWHYIRAASRGKHFFADHRKEQI